MNCCFYSSLLFLITAILAFYHNYYVYSCIFAALVVTSLIIHSHYSIYTNLIDKVSIVSVVLYGGYLLYTKCTTLECMPYVNLTIIALTFMVTVYLYYYGYYANKYCYDDDKRKANLYHSLLHLLSVIGHGMIIVL